MALAEDPACSRDFIFGYGIQTNNSDWLSEEQKRRILQLVLHGEPTFNSGQPPSPFAPVCSRQGAWEEQVGLVSNGNNYTLVYACASGSDAMGALISLARARHRTRRYGVGTGAVMSVFGAYNGSRAEMSPRFSREWGNASLYAAPSVDPRLIVPLNPENTWRDNFGRSTLTGQEEGDLLMVTKRIEDLAKDGIHVTVFVMELLMADKLTGYTPVFLKALTNTLHELGCCLAFDEVGRIYVQYFLLSEMTTCLR